MPKPPENLQNISSLVAIVEALRGPDGCPWDKAQTHQSLAPFTIEEAFELVDAIEGRSDQNLKEELGDLLFQVILHAQLAQERKAFSLNDVLQNIAEKLIRRHPHVFSDTVANTPQQVKENWEKIKQSEKSHSDQSSPFSSIPKNLPALQRSQKIGHKTIRYNFDWNDVKDVIAKVEEELGELKEAIAENQDMENQTLELGDLLFSVTQLARHLDIDAEQALRKTNRKFETRFEMMRALVKEQGLQFQNLPVEELEKFWQQAKKKLQ